MYRWHCPSCNATRLSPCPVTHVGMVEPPESQRERVAWKFFLENTTIVTADNAAHAPLRVVSTSEKAEPRVALIAAKRPRWPAMLICKHTWELCVDTLEDALVDGDPSTWNGSVCALDDCSVHAKKIQSEPEHCAIAEERAAKRIKLIN